MHLRYVSAHQTTLWTKWIVLLGGGPQELDIFVAPFQKLGYILESWDTLLLNLSHPYEVWRWEEPTLERDEDVGEPVLEMDEDVGEPEDSKRANDC